MNFLDTYRTGRAVKRAAGAARPSVVHGGGPGSAVAKVTKPMEIVTVVDAERAASILRKLEGRLHRLNTSTEILEPRRTSFGGGGEYVTNVVVGVKKVK